MQLSASERDGEDTSADDALLSSKPTPLSGTDQERFHETTAVRRQPGKPTNVTVAPYETGRNARETLSISWTANPNGNKVITNHEIEWSQDGTANSWNNLRTVSGGLTETLFTGLSPGTTRHIRIRSEDSDGWGLWSDAVSGTTNAPTRPGIVPSRTAMVTGPTTIDLSWTAPDDGGSAITKYVIVVAKAGDTKPFITIDDIEPTTRSYTVTGLTASTSYNISIRAENDRGRGDDGLFVPITLTTNAPTRPGIVPSRTAMVTGPTTIDLSWTAPDDGGSAITKYVIVVAKAGDTKPFITIDDIEPTTRSYTVTGLTASTSYNISIRAENDRGRGDDGLFVPITLTTDALTAPAAPTGLTATADGRTKIKLTWTAPSDNGGAAITGYKIEARKGTSGTWADLVPDTKTTKTDSTHTGLTPGTQWFYRVSAINSEGPGAASNVDDATTAAATRPSAPRNLTATADGRTTINLRWTAPADNGGSAITGYELQFSENKTPRVWIQLGGGNITGMSYAHTGRSAGTRYHYRLRASNNRGSSDWTSEMSARTAAAMGPGRPTGLTATADGQTKIKLSWTAPTNDGGAAITGYRIDIQRSTWVILVANTGTTDTEYTHTGLKPSTTHSYAVRAINSVRASGVSNVATATTVAAPTLTAPAAPTGLTATADGPETISLFWNAPTDNGGAAITGYQIEVSPNGTDSWDDLEANTGSIATGYTHTGLDAGTRRYYRVRAINSQGTGAASNVDDATTSPATVPAAPTELTATPDGQTIINLKWKAPTNRGGVPITGYQIEVSLNGTDTWTDVTPAHTGTGRTYSHTGLSPGTTQYYRVYARNSKGLSAAASNVVNATTSAATATRPGAPTGLTATASGQTIINLRWNAPSDNGGAAITGYQIEVSSTGVANTWTELVPNHTTTTYAHTGLSPNTTRHYRVRAINSAGTGAASNTVNATTSPPAATAPGAPTQLMATASGPTIINLSWTTPSNTGGADITGYRIEVSPNGTDTWTNLVANTRATTTTYAHRNLLATTTRHYRVRAINSVNPGAPSNVANATTAAATAPGAPTGLTATAEGQTIINLSWTAPTDNGGAPITGYQIEVSPNGTSNWSDLEANTPATATTYAHTGLSAGVTRHYRVRAINSVGPGAVSATRSATTNTPNATVPDAPSQLTATAAGRTIINLSWTAPSDNGGTTITGYQIEVSNPGSTNWSELAMTTGTTYAHTNLAPETTQMYRVRAINSVGNSDASNTASATTDALATPDAPTGLTITASGPSTLVLSWTAPLDDGGSAITGYRIDRSSDGQSDWTVLVASTPSTTYTVTNLTPGAPVYFRVIALNAMGQGTPSEVVNVTPKALSLSSTISDQIYPIGQPIAEVTLPEARDGTTPYSYTLTPDLPAGLTRSERTLRGTPSELTAMTSFTWQVQDATGTMARQDFGLEVYRMSFTTRVDDQVVPRGQPIPMLVLPEVSGAKGQVEYSFTTLLSLPSGLRFDLPTRTVSGTPLAVTPPTPMTFKAVDVYGAEDSLNFRIEVVSPVHTEAQAELPQELILHANYPNPFQGATNLLFDLPWPAEIKIDVMDMTGRRVYTHPPVHMTAGREQVLPLDPVALPAGAYLYRMMATSLENGTSSVKIGHVMTMR